MDFHNKRVLVVGLGKSGVASALFLKAKGAHVTVSDAKSEDQLSESIPVLLDAGRPVAVVDGPPRPVHGAVRPRLAGGIPLEVVAEYGSGCRLHADDADDGD